MQRRPFPLFHSCSSSNAPTRIKTSALVCATCALPGAVATSLPDARAVETWRRPANWERPCTGSQSALLLFSVPSAPFARSMSLDSATAAAPLQFEAWHELRVKADPLSWSDNACWHQTDCGCAVLVTRSHAIVLLLAAVAPIRQPPYPLHNTNFYFKLVHDNATDSFCLIVTDLCFVWLTRMEKKQIDAEMKVSQSWQATSKLYSQLSSSTAHLLVCDCCSVHSALQSVGAQANDTKHH